MPQDVGALQALKVLFNYRCSKKLILVLLCIIYGNYSSRKLVRIKFTLLRVMYLDGFINVVILWILSLWELVIRINFENLKLHQQYTHQPQTSIPLIFQVGIQFNEFTPTFMSVSLGRHSGASVHLRILFWLMPDNFISLGVTPSL